MRGLTDEQREVVTAPRSVAVTAGAGTGKTLVLAERYLFHVVEQGLSPLEVVAMTFTQRAAGELRARIRRLATERLPADEAAIAELEAAPIGTIHALCLRICREHPEAAGVPHSFGVIDEEEGGLITASWLNEALDRLPGEIFEAIPFSRLRSTLRRLLSDPVVADAALRVGTDRWAEWSEAEIERVLNELIASSAWQQGLRKLRSDSGWDGDYAEEARQIVVEAAMDLEMGRGDWKEALERISEISLRGGSQSLWPSGGLKEVKAALKEVREAARETLREATAMELTEADERLAMVLPSLRCAWEVVRGSMRELRVRARLVDFAGIEEGALRALRHEEVQRHYRERWRALLIDEFQDTNPVQAEIIGLLSGDARLTVVGDEKQAIYGFRRADVGVFRRFAVEIEAGGGRSGRLTRSFRAHELLADGLNRVFEPLLGDLHAPLCADRQAPHTGPHIRLWVATGDGERLDELRRREATRLAEAVAGMLGEGVAIHDREAGGRRPVERRDLAIVARTWAALDSCQEALGMAGIPSVQTAGGSLLDTREAKDAMALLRFLADPEDSIALLATLRSPFFAVSDRLLQQLALADPGTPAGEISWWGRIGEAAETTRPAEVLRELLAARRTASPRRLLQLADRLTGYSAVIAALPGGERRLADWRGMADRVGSLELALSDDLFAISRRLRRLAAEGIEIPRPGIEAGDAVTLTTIHGAKGLEWPVVIVPDLARQPGRRHGGENETLFDATRGVGMRVGEARGGTDGGQGSKTPVIHNLLAREQRRREEEEARRLLYVAMTRARDALILSASTARWPGAGNEAGLLGLLMPALDAAGVIAEPW